MRHRRSSRRHLPRPDLCPVTGKVRWPDSKAAVEVLHRSRTAASMAEADGLTSRRREVRHYWCPACKGFHTTSQPAPGSTTSGSVAPGSIAS